MTETRGGIEVGFANKKLGKIYKRKRLQPIRTLKKDRGTIYGSI